MSIQGEYNYNQVPTPKRSGIEIVGDGSSHSHRASKPLKGAKKRKVQCPNQTGPLLMKFFYLTGFGRNESQLKWEEMPTWMFSPHKDYKCSWWVNLKVTPCLVAEAMVAAASLCPTSHSGTILPQTPYFLGLIIKTEAPCVPSFVSHCFTHLYILSFMTLTTDLRG